MPAPGIKPRKVSDIKSKLLRPALTSIFLCEFYPPKFSALGSELGINSFMNARERNGYIGANYSGENQEIITLSCSEASLPGSSLATNEINNDYTGVTERHVYRRLYDDRSDFTFYVDRDYRVINFFESWISYIVGEDNAEGQQQRTYNYRVNFPEYYKTDNLYITKTEKDYNGRVLRYKFINAFPISINSMPVSYDSSQLLKCTVSFTYSRYTISHTYVNYEGNLNNKNTLNPFSAVRPDLTEPAIIYDPNGSRITLYPDGSEVNIGGRTYVASETGDF